MESLNTFESEMETDGQGSYALFPALESIASLSGAAETLERLLISKTKQPFLIQARLLLKKMKKTGKAEAYVYLQALFFF